MISVKRLLPPVSATGKQYKLVLNRIAGRHHEEYTVCVVKSDESAVLLKCSDGHANYSMDSGGAAVSAVSAILVTPCEKKSRNDRNDQNTITITSGDDEPQHFFLDASGSSESCVFLPQITREPDPQVIAAGRQAYAAHKHRLWIDTVCVVSGVGLSVNAAGHGAEAGAFALGGVIGIGFLAQLFLQVDNIEKAAPQKVFGLLRFLTTAGAIGFLDHTFQSQIHDQPGLLVWALLGFMSCRLAFIER